MAIENFILHLYAKGMSNSDIEEQMREVYNFEVSTSTISRITKKVTENIVARQNRPLEPVNLIVWMHGIVFKVRENSRVNKKIIYIAVRLRRDDKKELLGLWLDKNESAAFWMSVLTDIIRNVFPELNAQICKVRQIRSAYRYIVLKDKKAFVEDKKHIYSAPNRQVARATLEYFAGLWESSYFYDVKSWKYNSEDLTVFLSSR